ncbi:hypothetical protein SAMN05421810_10768 [Amycolatopsis arida]|uniref:Uncharacterized protein n=2 Tax=Amycolatopsis arida TaxID=587909 RepID=A0A1I5YCI2_9PSEU|nr:hypothetical protein CLV69_10768 [Amycolatopsis arida]SFQ41945.1 hypothetical protein SAMN05421810_10768 [Amycolatopsis arida]
MVASHPLAPGQPPWVGPLGLDNPAHRLLGGAAGPAVDNPGYGVTVDRVVRRVCGALTPVLVGACPIPLAVLPGGSGPDGWPRPAPTVPRPAPPHPAQPPAPAPAPLDASSPTGSRATAATTPATHGPPAPRVQLASSRPSSTGHPDRHADADRGSSAPGPAAPSAPSGPVGHVSAGADQSAGGRHTLAVLTSATDGARLRPLGTGFDSAALGTGRGAALPATSPD